MSRLEIHQDWHPPESPDHLQRAIRRVRERNGMSTRETRGMLPSDENATRLRELTGWKNELSLGFLIRQLPRHITTDTFFLGKPMGRKSIHFLSVSFRVGGVEEGGYTFYYQPMETASSKHWSKAQSPEDAAALCLISLIESGDWSP